MKYVERAFSVDVNEDNDPVIVNDFNGCISKDFCITLEKMDPKSKKWMTVPFIKSSNVRWRLRFSYNGGFYHLDSEDDDLKYYFQRYLKHSEETLKAIYISIALVVGVVFGIVVFLCLHGAFL